MSSANARARRRCGARPRSNVYREQTSSNSLPRLALDEPPVGHADGSVAGFSRVLFAGEENTLHFEQDLAVNYLQESFGLTSFYFPAIKREPLERKIEKKLKNKTIIPSKEKKAAVPVKRRISRVVLSAAAILLVSFFVWLPLHSDLMRKIDYSSLNPFASKPQPRYQPAEIALPDVDVTKADVANLLAMASDTTRYLNIVINGSIPIVIQLKEDATTVVKSKKKDSFSTQRYHVVGGAFAISENAEKFHQKLTKAGYQASIIDKKGKTLRFVSYGGYATKEEAMQALEKIRSVQGDAWLMIN